MPRRPARSSSRRQHALVNGYRSGLEEGISLSLQRRGAVFTYEDEVLLWQPEAKWRRYTPDFVITGRRGQSIYVETKGYFTAADRMKMLAVKKHNPDLDIRFVFQRANTRLSKTSPTTYGMWATKYGFQWAEGDVPSSWLAE